MATINLDTNLISDKAENIINLSKEYDMIVDKLFNELINLEESSWTGDAAKQYTGNALLDKAQYKVFGNDVNIYGQTLKKTAELYDDFIRKWDLK